MNAEGTKRLHLIKSLVREQGADGDKCWLIVQLETESLEAGVRIAELEALFDLQQTRMAEATRMWQEAMGKQDVLPDLGDLLAWLMARSVELEAMVRKLRDALTCADRDLAETAVTTGYRMRNDTAQKMTDAFARADNALAGEPGEGGEQPLPKGLTTHMHYLGTLGLLGECAVHVPEELREMIEQAMDDACAENPSLSWRRILNRIEIQVMSPAAPRGREASRG